MPIESPATAFIAFFHWSKASSPGKGSIVNFIFESTPEVHNTIDFNYSIRQCTLSPHLIYIYVVHKNKVKDTEYTIIILILIKLFNLVTYTIPAQRFNQDKYTYLLSLMIKA